MYVQPAINTYVLGHVASNIVQRCCCCPFVQPTTVSNNQNLGKVVVTVDPKEKGKQKCNKSAVEGAFSVHTAPTLRPQTHKHKFQSKAKRTKDNNISWMDAVQSVRLLSARSLLVSHIDFGAKCLPACLPRVCVCAFQSCSHWLHKQKSQRHDTTHTSLIAAGSAIQPNLAASKRVRSPFYFIANRHDEKITFKSQ